MHVKKLNVAVIGLGTLGTRYARVFKENERTNLKAVSDLDDEKADEVAAHYNVKAYTSSSDILGKEELDAVAIATPDHVHTEIILTALKNNLHVIVEKPLTTDSESAKKIIDEAAKTDRIIMVNYSQRFVTDFLWIKKKIKDGIIGQPQMIQSVKFDTLYVPTRMISWAAKTSPFFFMTSHDLDLICWFLNDRPGEVYAQEVDGVLKSKGIDVHDGVQAIVRFKSGVSAFFHSSWIHPESYPTIAGGSLEIIGSKGFIRYSMLDRKATLYTNETNHVVQFDGLHTADEQNGRIEGAFPKSINHFLDMIEKGEEPDTSAKHTLHVTLAQCAAMESIKKNKPVQIFR